MSTSPTIEQLEAAIAALEAQRGLLGDAVVDGGTAPMREALAVMRSRTRVRRQRLRTVLVLLMDFVASTEMCDELDAEDTHAIDTSRSEACLASGHALLMKRAEPLGDDERAGFLRRVPSHRALLEACEEQATLATTLVI